MKVLFIETKKKSQAGNISLDEIKAKFTKLHILYSIQYKSLAEQIKKKLVKEKIKIKGFEQVLGCSKIKPKADLLLIGSGKFHAINLALSSGKEVYIYNINKLDKISKQEIEKQRKKQKGRLLKFYRGNSIGILVSSKLGQKNMKKAKQIKKKLEKKFPNKNFYLFISNNIIIDDLENYDISIWINTACPGLEYDSGNILNYENLEKNL